MTRVRIATVVALLAVGVGTAGCFGQQPKHPVGDTTSYTKTVTTPTQSATTSP